MIYTTLRDYKCAPILQQRVLKKFTEKQLLKFNELDHDVGIDSEAVKELLSALKELTELT